MKFLPRNLALAACSAAAGLLIPSRAIAETVYPTTEIPCPYPAILEGEVYGETYTCGIITVPENYDEPDGRQIELSYAVFYSQSLSPAPDPVIYLAGGPGASPLSALDQLASNYAGQRRTRDIVLFNQRGTQFSNRLACAPVAFATAQFNQTDNEYYDQFQELLSALQARYPESSEDEIYKYAYFLLCGQILEANGSDLDQYNTATNARDVISLTDTLGYEDLNLYGISYGTYLGQQLLRDYSDRLRSVVLDSTLAQHVQIHEAWIRDTEVVLFNLIEDCQTDAACAAAYPDLKNRTIDLVAQIAEIPIPLTTPIPDPDNPEATIDTVTIEQFEAVIGKLNGLQSRLVAPYLPLMIHELEQGETTTFAGIVSGELLAEVPAESPVETEALALQIEAEELRLQARNLLTQQVIQANTDRPGSQWVLQVINQSSTLPEAQQTRVLANFYGVGYQADMPRDRDTLLAFVAENFEGEAASTLSAGANALSDIEVRHAYEYLSYSVDASVLPVDARSTRGMYWSVVCNDIAPFSDPAVTDDTLATMDIPALGQSRYIESAQAYAVCATWPVAPSRDEPFNPVESDVPTMVLQGRYDLATTTAVGPQVLEGLSNGVYVEFPSSGHSVINFSQCAKDIGTAFILAPDQESDTSCTANLTPEFVLPPQEG